MIKQTTEKAKELFSDTSGHTQLLKNRIVQLDVVDQLGLLVILVRLEMAVVVKVVHTTLSHPST